MRRVNLRFVTFLLAIFVVLGGGLYFIHGYQVKRNAWTLLAQADREEEQGRRDQAADYLARYVALAPQDRDALSRYGLLLEQLARTDKARLRAFFVLERALREQPDREDVRRRLIELSLQFGRFSDALAHLEPLLAASPDDGELLLKQGICHDGSGQLDEAKADYEKAIEKAPDRLEGYQRLAGLLRLKLEKGVDADSVIEKMIARNGESLRAHLVRTVYYRQYGQPDRAAESLARAFALAPDDADVLLAMSLGTKKEEGKDARKYLERGVSLYPKDARFYVDLARLEIRERHYAEAVRRLRDCLANASQEPDLLWNVADLLMDANESGEATELVDRLEKGGYPAPHVDYLRGRLQFRAGAWLAASSQFNQALPHFANVPVLARQTNFFLGQCHEQLGNPDLALSAYREASAADPLWVPARAGVASAALSLGKFDLALDEYRTLQASAPESRFVVIRLLILQNLTRALKDRNWTEVETAINQAEQAFPESIQVPILRVEVLAGQNKLKEAQALLEGVKGENRKHAEYWVARAGVADRLKQLEQVVSLLDEGEKLLGANVNLRLARINHWSKLPGAQATALLAKQEQELSGWSAADQIRLRDGLASAYYRLEKADDAERLWKEVAAAEGQQNNLHIRFLLFDLAVKADNDETDGALTKLVGEFRANEGDAGSLWRYAEAARLVRLAQREKEVDANLARARTHLVEVAKRRPTWSRVPLLQGMIAELEGDQEAAIKSYQQAVDRGERQPTLILRVARMLSARGRYLEADQLIAKLPEQLPISGEVAKLAAEISLRKQDGQRALELALQAVPSESDKYTDHLWIGQVQWAVGRNEEAEKHFRRAIALAETVPDPWVALVQFLARIGESERAEKVLVEAREKLPAGVQTLALAQGYEALGKRDRAEELYQEALKAKPDDPAVLRGVADFYLRTGRTEKAEPHLVALLKARVKGVEELAWARRKLAFCLAARANPAEADRALRLLDENRRGKTDAIEDQRTRAVVLALQPDRHAEARRLLEELGRRQPLTPDERFMLARLYEVEGDWATARQRLQSLATAHPDRPQYLVYFANALLQRGDVDQAAFWLANLEKVEPDSARTLELRVRVLKARGKADEALTLLRAQSGKKEIPEALVAVLLDLMGPPAADEAEAAFRRIARDSKKPADYLRLAHFLARHGRLDEALDWCERAGQATSPDTVASVSVGLLRLGSGTPQQTRRVESWLTEAMKKQPTVSLMLAQAELRDFQTNYEEAIRLYRSILQRDERNALALNNLAWLLALHVKRPDEALLTINRAVASAGPTPTLLDTRAVIQLQLGQANSALKDLDHVLAREPSGSVHFHRAWALLKANKRSDAEEAMQRAKTAGLQPVELHALEQGAYREVVASLNVK